MYNESQDPSHSRFWTDTRFKCLSCYATHSRPSRVPEERKRNIKQQLGAQSVWTFSPHKQTVVLQNEQSPSRFESQGSSRWQSASATDVRPVHLQKSLCNLKQAWYSGQSDFKDCQPMLPTFDLCTHKTPLQPLGMVLRSKHSDWFLWECVGLGLENQGRVAWRRSSRFTAIVPRWQTVCPVSYNSSRMHWRLRLGDYFCRATPPFGRVTVFIWSAMVASGHPTGEALVDGRSPSCNLALGAAQVRSRGTALWGSRGQRTRNNTPRVWTHFQDFFVKAFDNKISAEVYYGLLWVEDRKYLLSWPNSSKFQLD